VVCSTTEWPAGQANSVAFKSLLAKPQRAASQWAEQVCDRILRVHVGHSARDYGGADDVFITRVGSSQARGAEHWHMFHLTIR
jgi:hypothetical protein